MSDCAHQIFDVTEHDYCPDCGDQDVRKIIDERRIAELEAENERLNHLFSEAQYLLETASDRLAEWEDDKFAARRCALLRPQA